MTSPAPPLSVPIVWAELVCSDVEATLELLGSVLGWKPERQPGTSEATIYLDQARTAGPICGVRRRSPADPVPNGVEGEVPDRWGVRLAPPRPPHAVDPGGDQLLRPRAPGPRFGRWGVQHALCFFELRTADVPAAQAWLERRLDATLRASESDPEALLLESSLQPGTPIATVLQQDDPARAGWTGVVQVGDLERAVGLAEGFGATCTPRRVPPGFDATEAVLMVTPGGADLILAQRGSFQGHRG